MIKTKKNDDVVISETYDVIVIFLIIPDRLGPIWKADPVTWSIPDAWSIILKFLLIAKMSKDVAFA